MNFNLQPVSTWLFYTMAKANHNVCVRRRSTNVRCSLIPASWKRVEVLIWSMNMFEPAQTAQNSPSARPHRCSCRCHSITHLGWIEHSATSLGFYSIFSRSCSHTHRTTIPRNHCKSVIRHWSLHINWSRCSCVD